MRSQENQNNWLLTGFDRHLVTRIAYAMVVSGLWSRILQRRSESFDYFEILDQNGQPSYRVGRFADGKYVLLDLRSGLQKRGKSMAEVLRGIAYVPDSMDTRLQARP